MSETTTTDAESFELDANSTWIEAVELFQREGAEWLTAADAPQLMALRSIAKQLDGGTFQAALISQFTLIHRALLNRRPGEPQPPADPAGAARAAAMGPSLFEQLGGVWTADA
ncbi:hypothetical protein SEA_PUFFYCAT_1 [Microbacterium phage PuffyCat]|uniref:Uncharacterized protein n=1 Tax=Microbacterium phage Nobel TaxID=2725614 RepID=A0A6M3SXJ8_9CAUD|nr:hypothetical protein JTF55_gp01 [Microbacterium phage Nobel]AYD84497.1 hypothetical protein SEA_MIAURORA_1 [Microbacterium phage Miaurora]QXO13253.1 hypothetical protein SEA_TRIREME_1 [Microbacterium phage Trireme]WMI33993.1 hypothetical protein SEA_CLOWNERY_1 [Microbacterium phage Clownery]WNN94209.1 hypothetical protein SEA_PUFFYCAT_1 [Microbacterium phage PuffyCat]QJD50726.1 hypothetical protein SEA_NOBEL_1 [Microbacterium phage Nobel]